MPGIVGGAALADFLTTHWWTLATALYVSGFLAVSLWELAAPRRAWTVSTLRRWSSNFGVFVVGAGLTWLLIPVLSVGFAQRVAENGWGLFHVLGLGGAWTILAGILILDLAQYVEHWLVHRVPILWRLHRMHHADLDYDVITGFRFHPFEGLFAVAWRMGVIAAFGIPVVAVMLAELLLIAINYFVHGNVRLPVAWDAVLRRLIVTPDLHRVHHSIERRESNANFGSLFSFWDRLFGTCVEQPAAGHRDMVTGLQAFRDPRHMDLHWMLANPFLTADPAAPARAPHSVR